MKVDKIILMGMATVALAGCVLAVSSMAGQAKKREPWNVPANAKARKNPVAATAASRKNPVAATAASRAGGKEFYQKECLMCHGEKGDGESAWKDIIPTPLPDFTETAAMRRQTDGELFWKISEGRELMPAFGKRFSEEKLWRLVNYIRSLAPAEKKSR